MAPAGPWVVEVFDGRLDQLSQDVTLSIIDGRASASGMNATLADRCGVGLRNRRFCIEVDWDDSSSVRTLESSAVEVWGLAGSLMNTSGEAGCGVAFCLELSALSIITDANDADFERTRFGGDDSATSDSAASSVSFFLVLISFLAALPRTSSARTAAGFFFDLSSSDDLEDDIIVSRVPYAADLVRLPPDRLTCLVCSSSELIACSVGPLPFATALPMIASPGPCGGICTSYWLLRLYLLLAQISAILSKSSATPCRISSMMPLKVKASTGGSFSSVCEDLMAGAVSLFTVTKSRFCERGLAEPEYVRTITGWLKVLLRAPVDFVYRCPCVPPLSCRRAEIRAATVLSSNICSPRAASSVSIKLAVDAFALQRPGGMKWRGNECRRPLPGSDGAALALRRAGRLRVD